MAKLTKEYTAWLKQLKDRVRSAQVKAALKVNEELLSLYWDMGTEILYKETSVKWGDGWLYQLADDLSAEFPDVKGFSHTNLKYIRRWVTFYSNNLIGQQPVAQNKTAGKLIVEYSLKNISKPIGISEYQLTESIPGKLKGKLPTIKQIEKELKDIME